MMRWRCPSTTMADHHNAGAWTFSGKKRAVENGAAHWRQDHTTVRHGQGDTGFARRGAIPGGVACGFLVQIGGRTIYFAGDTGLFGDMRTAFG